MYYLSSYILFYFHVRTYLLKSRNNKENNNLDKKNNQLVIAYMFFGKCSKSNGNFLYKWLNEI